MTKLPGTNWPKRVLRVLYFFQEYPGMSTMRTIFRTDPKTIRKWLECVMNVISNLKSVRQTAVFFSYLTSNMHFIESFNLPLPPDRLDTHRSQRHQFVLFGEAACWAFHFDNEDFGR